MCVDHGDFGGRDARVLEFEGGAFLAAEDDDVGAFDGYGAGAALDGFEGVFDLEDVPVGGKDREGAVVAAGHGGGGGLVVIVGMFGVCSL